MNSRADAKGNGDKGALQAVPGEGRSIGKGRGRRWPGDVQTSVGTRVPCLRMESRLCPS